MLCCEIAVEVEGGRVGSQNPVCVWEVEAAKDRQKRADGVLDGFANHAIVGEKIALESDIDTNSLEASRKVGRVRNGLSSICRRRGLERAV